MTEDTTKHPQEGRGDGAPTDAGSTDSGASLGDIFKAALKKRDSTEDGKE